MVISSSLSPSVISFMQRGSGITNILLDERVLYVFTSFPVGSSNALSTAGEWIHVVLFYVISLASFTLSSYVLSSKSIIFGYKEKEFPYRRYCLLFLSSEKRER